jgi:hypothetical protein
MCIGTLTTLPNITNLKLGSKEFIYLIANTLNSVLRFN